LWLILRPFRKVLDEECTVRGTEVIEEKPFYGYCMLASQRT